MRARSSPRPSARWGSDVEWAALALLVVAMRRRASPRARPEPTPEPRPSPAETKPAPDMLDEVMGATKVVAPLGAAVGGLVAKGKAAAAAIAGVGAAVGGGALVVASWAVLVVVSQVVSRVIEPEINRRRTLPAWLTGDPWGFAWRGAREFFVSAIETRQEAAGLIRLVYRWADGDGRYGDLNVQGELVYLSGVADGAPGDRFAFYDALAWRRTAPVRVPRSVTDAAHALARAWGRAFLATACALADVSGQRTTTGPASVPLLASLVSEGAPTAPTSEPASVGAGYNEADLYAAVAGGVRAATGLARASYAEGGVWLFETVSRGDAATAVAAYLRAAGFDATASSSQVDVGGTFVVMPGGVAGDS